MTALAAALTATLVAACDAPQPENRAENFGPVGPAPQPERRADGTCWAHEVTPAVYEHVMGEVQVVQAEIAEDGSVLRPPIYRRAPVPRIVTPRGKLSFEVPCSDILTPEFVASVQRALAVRNYFSGNISGVMDAPTSAAIRKFQSERGLDSAQLSIETARVLGLIATPLEDL